MDIEVSSTKSTTFNRHELSKGFEADESYYIENAPLVRSVEEVDLAIHPGPDLVIEVDHTNSSMSKFGIYAGIRVAEVWRWVDEDLKLYAFDPDTKERSGYREISESQQLPGFPARLAVEVIGSRLDENETRMIRKFRQTITTSD